MAANIDRSVKIDVFDDLEALSLAAARTFVAASEQSISERGRFAVALSGGGTPQKLYSLLATVFRDRIAWDQVHLFWSDERYVPPDHEESNYRSARQSLLDHLTIPPENIHVPDTTLDDPEASAALYGREIRKLMAPGPPRFDWMLLGIGTDGHVASLFPGDSALEEKNRLVVAVHRSPKPPPVRLTMTLPLINDSREIHFLISGREKSRAFAETRRGRSGNLPAQRVAPRDGTLHFWVDRDAATLYDENAKR